MALLLLYKNCYLVVAFTMPIRRLKKTAMKSIFISLFIFYPFLGKSQVSSLPTENHYGIQTVSTNIDVLTGICELSLSTFRSMFEEIGYKDFGTKGSGIMMMKGALTDTWRTSITIDINGIMIMYYKRPESYSYHFTDDLIEALKPYYLRSVEKSESENCPQYYVKYEEGRSYTFTVCRNTTNEVIIVSKNK
ncbi:MAG: hypothetical protein WBC06_19200 [Chitinophagaceae bacterium]